MLAQQLGGGDHLGSELVKVVQLWYPVFADGCYWLLTVMACWGGSWVDEGNALSVWCCWVGGSTRGCGAPNMGIHAEEGVLSPKLSNRDGRCLCVIVLLMSNDQKVNGKERIRKWVSEPDSLMEEWTTRQTCQGGICLHGHLPLSWMQAADLLPAFVGIYS